MERYTMFMDQQNSYCETELQIPSNPYQYSNDIICRTTKISPKIYMEAQNILTSQINPNQKE
jgi:hypothetical protein